MPTGFSPSASGTPEPMSSAAPPGGAPPSGPTARARARWAVLRSGGSIVAGPGVALGRGVRFELSSGGRVRLGAGVAIGQRTRIEVRGGELDIGEHAILGDHCVVELSTASVIGDHARLADEVVVLDHRPVTDDVERPLREQGTEARPITIGNHVRIGPRAVVAAGVSIGARAQVSALAVVERDVPAGGLVTGATPGPRAPRARR